MSEHNSRPDIAEEELRKINGGAYSDMPGSSESLGSIDYPIMLASESDVRKFTDIASKYDFRITVYKNGMSVDGKSFEAVMALDRSGFVHVMANCRSTDTFASELTQFMVF